MKLYLDEDSAAARLAGMLRQAGHDVQTTNEAGLAGRTDPVQFTHAIDQGRVLLSRNYGDFEELHLLVLQAQGHHPGILVVRRDAGQRNMTAHDIVRAIHNLETASVPIADQYIILNAWR